MKLIILAAGQGVRLRPYTDHQPKCMVPFQEKPIIDRILETAQQCGIENVAVVTGYQKSKLETHLSNRNIQFFHNPDFDKTNMVTSLFCAQEAMTDDIIISYSDIVYTQPVLNALLEAKGKISVVVDKDWRRLWEIRMENPLLDAETLKLDADGNIIELGKKPTCYDEIEGQYVGLIKIAKSSLPEICQFYQGLDQEKSYDGKDFDNMYMTTFLQNIIDSLAPIKAVMIHGGWLEVDTTDDLERYQKYEGSLLE